MKQPVFTGACAAVVTPFDLRGNIDFPTFGQLIEYLIDSGIDAICVCGTTGECASLSVEERTAAIRFCVRKVGHRVKVIAGTGSNCTAQALYQTQSAAGLGADAALVVTPYYNKTSQCGLIRHFELIADHSQIPIILYNVPSRTGMTVLPETYRVLAQHPMVQGVKEASGDFSLLANTLSICGKELFVWTGNDEQVVPAMSLGAVGVISVAANLIPRIMVQMSHCCREGDFSTASGLQLTYDELIRALSVDVNPIPIKEALALAGHPVGATRLPLCELREEHRNILSHAMDNIGLLAC